MQMLGEPFCACALLKPPSNNRRWPVVQIEINIIDRQTVSGRTMMASSGLVQVAGLLLAVQLLFVGAAADQEPGTVIPAESRPCVDCHAFEFMQRALQDLKKTAFNLDARTETLVLRAERRALCDCMPTNSLR
ncbi:NELL2-interacting cell ontogeny regulator 1 isoform X1 [Echeneis naucrates]|uniref:NELL2-interacting cell ontogeny regulator 1 n=2 Tax=Echeneis naucrates TaxID=173247 RepID=A0A665V0G7_ECHNA|nr:neuropeptide-like protein C4orf48 homolog isoform X1 [Echeneis naucrates]